jgi:predicted RNase H-like nuclease (RuvC/YqgF family)
MDELITALIATGASAVSALVTFLLARRKYNAEVTSTEYENFAKMIASYRDTIEDNQRRLDRYQAEIERCDKEIFALRTENRDLRNQLQNLSLQIIKQTPRK